MTLLAWPELHSIVEHAAPIREEPSGERPYSSKEVFRNLVSTSCSSDGTPQATLGISAYTGSGIRMAVRIRFVAVSAFTVGSPYHLEFAGPASA